MQRIVPLLLALACALPAWAKRPTHPLTNILSCTVTDPDKGCRSEEERLAKDALLIYRHVDYGAYRLAEAVLCRDGRLQLSTNRLRFVGRFGIQVKLSPQALDEIKALLAALPAVRYTSYGLLSGESQSYSYLFQPSKSAKGRLDLVMTVTGGKAPPASYQAIHDRLRLLADWQKQLSGTKQIRIEVTPVPPRNRSRVLAQQIQKWPFLDRPLMKLVAGGLSSKDWKTLADKLRAPPLRAFGDDLFIDGSSLGLSGPASLAVLGDLKKAAYLCAERPW